MFFKQCVSTLAKALKTRSAIAHTLFLTLAMLAFDVQALSPSQVFNKVKDSVVVVKSLDAKGMTIGQGSGVLLPSGKIGTNCHVVESGARFQVGGGKQFVPATLWGSDEDKDICLLEASGLTAQPAQLGQAKRLKVGEPVYAVGAPRGLELSLSDGIVSQLRGGPPPLIQTTAAISPGSSGGGLFDAEGRLVGFTTLYIEGGQSLNFAMPVEWAGEIQRGKKAAQGRSEGDWTKRAIAFEDAKNWTGLRDWCQQWTQAQPGNGSAWFGLGGAYTRLQRYTEAIEAYRQALRINTEDALAWIGIGYAYNQLKRGTEAIEAYRQALRINTEDANAWGLLGIAYFGLRRYTEAVDAARQAVRIEPEGSGWFILGGAYGQLRRYTEAIEADRQALRINPEDSRSWTRLGAVYTQLQRNTEAIEALRQAVRIDPENANAWGLLAISYDRSGNRMAALEAVRQLRRIDPAEADKLFNVIVPR
jgi:tetratricopeptide (TPR) repeat protein